MGKIFVTSDTHFGHDREFIWGPRGFSSVHEMNKEIVRRWNEVVTWEDDVYLLGDVMLGDNEVGLSLLKQLNGEIHIILGNHDTNARIDLYNNKCHNVVDYCFADRIKYNGYHFYLSHYPTYTSNLEKDGDALQKHLLNLYGHTHQKTNFYNDIPFMYHVGLDSHNCYPVLLDDIIEDIKNKVQECKKYL